MSRIFFCSSRRRHTRLQGDWSSDVCSSDLFTLGLVVAALRYYEEGHPIYLTLAAISAALLFATKETAIISAGVLVIAIARSEERRVGKGCSSRCAVGA